MPEGQKVDSETGDRTQGRKSNRPALDMLDTDPETGERRLWICQLGRSRIERIPFEALIAYAAVQAWRRRGPIWGNPREDGSHPRESAETPPGGWPALAGVSGKTWAAYRDKAIRLKAKSWASGRVRTVDAAILAHASGEPRRQRARRKVPLLKPLIAEFEEGEQRARIPAAVLFHDGLALRAKRTYAALALRADRERMVYVANESLANDTGFHIRAIRRLLRDLETAGAIERRAQSHRHGVRPVRLRD